MPALFRNSATMVWGLLVIATLVSWYVGTEEAAQARELATVGVVLIAFVKVRFVGLYFMELRHAKPLLRLLFEGWVVAACAVVIAIYWLAPRLAA